jgi:hypothetical protein
MTKFWQTKPKKEKPEDRKPRKLVIDEKCLNASKSCPWCHGRGYLVVGAQPSASGGKPVSIMAYCECVVRQLSLAERKLSTIVLRSP